MADPTSQLAPDPVPFFATADGLLPTPNPLSIGTCAVSRSGELIVFRPTDVQGHPLAVTGLRSADDIQLISLTGIPSSSSMTLRLGDQTTPPIPLDLRPPLTAFVASATLPGPGSYDLSLSFGYPGVPPTGRVCTQTLVRVFDGSTLVGSLVLDQSQYPDPAVDLYVPSTGVFKSLGTFPNTTGTLTIWLSGPSGSGPVLSGNFRIAPHNNSDPNLVGYINSTPIESRFEGNLVGKGSVERFGSWTKAWSTNGGIWKEFFYALPSGNEPTAFPSPAAVQGALLALPTVPPRSATVAWASNQSLVVHFTGDLAGRALPSLVTSDPALTVTHDDSAGSNLGGQLPILTVNGVAHPLSVPIYAPGMAVIAYQLPQDSPVVQYRSAGEDRFTPLNYDTIHYDVGFSQRVAWATQAGVVGKCSFDGLIGPADYEVALTWPSGDPSGDRLQCLVQDAQGNPLGQSAGIDQAQAPADFQDRGVGWSTVVRFHLPAPSTNIRITLQGAGTAGKHCLIDAIRLTRTSADRGLRIKAGDDLRFDAPSGFIATTAGPLPALRAFPVRPLPDRRFPALGTQPRTMKLGMNCDPPTYYVADSCYSNYAIMALNPIGRAPGTDGSPTQLLADPYNDRGRATVILSIPATDGRGAGMGAPNCSGGTWVLRWSSVQGVECELLASSNTTTVVEDTTRRVAGVSNVRFYQVTNRGSTAPSLGFQVLSHTKNPDGSFACDLRDLAIYPPDVDPNQPGRWRPSFLAKLRGLQCFRTMDFFGTNNLNLASFDQFPDPAHFPLGFRERTIAVPILSIGPPEADPFCDMVRGPVVRVKTRVPHGLTTGFLVSLRTTDGSSLGQVQSHVIDPATGQTTTTPHDSVDPTNNVRGLCHVIDDTTIQIGLDLYFGPTARMTNTLTPAHGIVFAEVAPGCFVPPADAADLCRVAGLEPWINVPWLATDDCVAQLAQTFLDRLAPEVPVHVEYGNEAWNYFFYGFHYAYQMNRLTGGPDLGSVPHYTKRMGQVHQIFRNVWRQAGRDETKVRRVCGVQQDYPGGTTSPILEQAVALGSSFDELAVASYFNNNTLQGPADDLLTREQILDILALNVELGVTASQMSAHQTAIAAAVAGHPDQDWLNRIEIVNYEGGPDTMTTPGMTINLAERNHGVHRHPEFREIMLHWLASLDDVGVRLFNIFTMYGVRDINQWGVYEGFNTQPGTGDPVLDQANIDDFENLLAVKSQTAGALQEWASLLAPPVKADVWTLRGGARAYGAGSRDNLYRVAI